MFTVYWDRWRHFHEFTAGVVWTELSVDETSEQDHIRQRCSSVDGLCYFYWFTCVYLCMHDVLLSICAITLPLFYAGPWSVGSTCVTPSSSDALGSTPKFYAPFLHNCLNTGFSLFAARVRGRLMFFRSTCILDNGSPPSLSRSPRNLRTDLVWGQALKLTFENF